VVPVLVSQSVRSVDLKPQLKVCQRIRSIEVNEEIFVTL
jgi:hypothetical protein